MSNSNYLPFNTTNVPENNNEKQIARDLLGRVISVKDGVVFVSGLDNLQMGELVGFGTGVYGICSGEETSIRQDDPVVDHLFGRVLNGLGYFIAIIAIFYLVITDIAFDCFVDTSVKMFFLGAGIGRYRFSLLQRRPLYLVAQRSMLTSKNLVGRYIQTTKVVPLASSTHITPEVKKSYIKRDVHYHVDDANAMSSSHELAQKNPLLQKGWKKTPISNSFQHPVIGQDTCVNPECDNKICNAPCNIVLSRVYIGHVTHSNKYGVFISYFDFNNQREEQYFVPYIRPVINYDVIGNNINTDRTHNLNATNTDARNMIHILRTKSTTTPPNNEDIL